MITPQPASWASASAAPADGAPGFPQRVQLRQDGLVRADPTFQRRRVDLVEVEVFTEERTALLDLPSQRRQGMILYLVDASIDLPIADVRVAPFGSHGDGVRWERALAEPRGEETLGESVGAGSVEVADAGVKGGAQDVVGAALQ